MSTLDFIMGVEDGSLSEEDFFDNVQEFVDSGIWRFLQGGWQRMVYAWVDSGYCDDESEPVEILIDFKSK